MAQGPFSVSNNFLNSIEWGLSWGKSIRVPVSFAKTAFSFGAYIPRISGFSKKGLIASYAVGGLAQGSDLLGNVLELSRIFLDEKGRARPLKITILTFSLIFRSAKVCRWAERILILALPEPLSSRVALVGAGAGFISSSCQAWKDFTKKPHKLLFSIPRLLKSSLLVYAQLPRNKEARKYLKPAAYGLGVSGHVIALTRECWRIRQEGVLMGSVSVTYVRKVISLIPRIIKVCRS